MFSFTRHPTIQEAYNSYKQQTRDRCPFCHLDPVFNRIVEQTEQFTIIYNAFPYDETSQHLLLFPNQHYEHLTEFPPELKQGLWKLINVYLERYPQTLLLMRGPANLDGTIAHMHVHFITPENKNAHAHI